MEAPPRSESRLLIPAADRYGVLMSKKKARQSRIPTARIERSILLMRGQKVMLDSDLAELYGVETKVLLQAVKRNIRRFPDDFMFQLTKEEFQILRSQTVTSSWGGRRHPPYVFTRKGPQCCRASCEATGRSTSTCRSCGRSSISVKCCHRTKTWPGSWLRWKRSTMNSSKLSSRRSAS